MKIKKTVKLYSLKFNDPSEVIDDIFPVRSTTLYFKTQEEAELYRNKYHPSLSVEENLAIHDTDKAGKDRWTLLNDAKCLFNAKYLGASYELSSELEKLVEKLVKENPESVIVVREKIDEKTWFYENSSGYCSKTTITVDVSDIVDASTKFIYVSSSSERYRPYSYVTRGDQVTLTSAMDLVDEKRKEDEKKFAVKKIADDKARLFHLREEVFRLADEIKALETTAQESEAPKPTT